MKYINSKVKPNPNEASYWVDLKENPYGGVIKYYDQDQDDWTYIEEPLFQNSVAYNITQHQLDALDNVGDVSEQLDNLQKQIDNINDSSINLSDVYIKDEIDTFNKSFDTRISKQQNDISLLATSVTNRINEVDRNLEIKTSELSNALSSKASYIWVDERIKQIIAASPDALNTLEELAAALGNDPNFATTITELIGKKLNSSDAITLINETVPVWARKENKPTYTAKEVGALPITTAIPERTSQLTNDAGYLTQLEVNSLIQSNKPLTTEQYNKINKLDSYIVYELNTPNISIPIIYDTVVANLASNVTTLDVKFENKPIAGSQYSFYVNPSVETSIVFNTLSNKPYHTVYTKDIMRFDIKIIDLTKYELATQNGNTLLTSDGHTIVVNAVDGYIIDYVKITSDESLTWYEGE